jgi:hypothetical protein
MARTKWTRAQMLRDPNKRKNIPTSQLPAKYRAARLRRLSAAKDAKNPLLNPTTPLAGRDLRVAVNDLVEYETRPKLDAADFEINSAGVQSAALANRHGQVAGKVVASDAASSARLAAISQKVRENMARIAQEGGNAVDASGQAAQAALGQANTGLQGSAAERLAVERAALNARQAGVSTAYRSSNEAISGIDESHQAKAAATNQARLAEQAGAAQIRQSNNMAKLAAERASIEASRGPLRTENLLKLRQQSFDNILLGEQFGLKKQEVANEAAEIKSSNKQASDKARQDAKFKRWDIDIKRGIDPITGKKISKAKQRTWADRLAEEKTKHLQRTGRLPSSADPKSDKPAKEPAPAGKRRDRIDQLNVSVADLNERPNGGAASSLRGVKDPKKRRQIVARVLKDRAAREGISLSDLELSAALDLYYDGHVSKRNAARLERFDVNVGRVKPSRRRKPRQASRAASRPGARTR